MSEARVTNLFDEKTQRNKRVLARYDDLMAEGKHGHYEAMFRVVREECESAYLQGRKDMREEAARVAEDVSAWKDIPGDFEANSIAQAIRELKE